MTNPPIVDKPGITTTADGGEGDTAEVDSEAQLPATEAGAAGDGGDDAEQLETEVEMADGEVKEGLEGAAKKGVITHQVGLYMVMVVVGGGCGVVTHAVRRVTGLNDRRRGTT